jgi:hypothetical protein
MREFLLHVLQARLTPERYAWLADATRDIAAGAPEQEIVRCYTDASRKVGKFLLQLNDRERHGLSLLDKGLVMDHWAADETARAVFLLMAEALPPKEYERLVLQCYELGDTREQQSWLRSLSLLPKAERFLATAIDSCRTNVTPLFEAIACENPYPARYFPELNFNQMVLKCLFNGIELCRVVYLDSRLNPEMARMAEDYARERMAAGRTVPADIWMAGATSQEESHYENF